ncbi:MAG: hypothetical protein IJ787_03000 [Bacilli bacterium]|nr:hypothetical protein [Bacilli bacterium]
MRIGPQHHLLGIAHPSGGRADFEFSEIAQQPAVQSDKGRFAMENAQQVAVELFSVPWGHHMAILGKAKSAEESLFYVHKAYANGWSRGVLLNFLKSGLYFRQGKATTNFALTLPETDSDLAQQLTRDPYNFNFIAIERRYKERRISMSLLYLFGIWGYSGLLQKHQENPVLSGLSGSFKRTRLKARRPYLTIDRDGWAPAV